MRAMLASYLLCIGHPTLAKDTVYNNLGIVQR